MAKDKGRIKKDDQKLSALIADHNAKVKSDAAGSATPARGYQKTND